MAINYPYYTPPYGQIQQQQPYTGIKGRPVSSFEEARASMIDFDGSVFYFPDLANQRIYTKQINLDGTPSIKIYELATMPQQQVSVAAENLVTKEEFDKTISNLLQQIEILKAHAESPPQTQVSIPQPQDYNF